MRRVAFFMMATLCGVAAFGQGLLDCIEPDVLRALLLQGQGERVPVVTAALPSELTALKMPGAFIWIGSAERVTDRVDASTSASLVTAAWRSNLPPAAARTAAATALTASGWELSPAPGMNMSVFSAASMPVPLPACRDGKPVNIIAGAMDGVTYLLITLQRGNSNADSTCNRPAWTFGISSNGLEPYMPHLEMAVDPAADATMLTLSSGGNAAGSFVARAEFLAKDSVGNVARHFAQQMAEQGWTSDTNWSGRSTAGSSWSKRADANTLIQGTLSITAVDERRFMAVLRLIRLQ